MRTFYLFRINKYFTYMYKDKPYKMYKIINDIYYARNINKTITYRYFAQMAIYFNKESLNTYLDSLNIHAYHRSGNISYIVKDNIVVSKLVINNSYLKISTLGNYSIFFSLIKDYAKDIFVCDFINNDYFWLDKINASIDNKVVI